MNRARGPILCSMLLVLAWAGLTIAQEQPATGAAEEEPALETLDEAAAPQPDTEPAEDDDPLAGADAEEPAAGAEGEVTGATMERFNPTEKISEDRSVAFPNDI